jgi:glutamate synthase (NADPH/NADH) small chain
MDCLRAAIRYGARETICVYRREEADMPCSRQEHQNAVEEGAQFVFCAAPLAVLGNSGGEVTGLQCVRTEMGPADVRGHRRFQVRPGTEFQIGADWVIPALGFDPLPCPREEDFSRLAANDWGGLRVDVNQMTTVAGVFAGGDIVRGPCLLLHTVRDGRLAAKQIDAFLSRK